MGLHQPLLGFIQHKASCKRNYNCCLTINYPFRQLDDKACSSIEIISRVREGVLGRYAPFANYQAAEFGFGWNSARKKKNNFAINDSVSVELGKLMS